MVVMTVLAVAAIHKVNWRLRDYAVIIMQSKIIIFLSLFHHKSCQMVCYISCETPDR